MVYTAIITNAEGVMMAKTRHIQARMSQRGIEQKLLAMTLDFGVEHENGRVILNRQGLASLMQELRDLHQAAERAVIKGGLVIVRSGDTLITAYRLDSYRPMTGAGASQQVEA